MNFTRNPYREWAKQHWITFTPVPCPYLIQISSRMTTRDYTFVICKALHRHQSHTPACICVNNTQPLYNDSGGECVLGVFLRGVRVSLAVLRGTNLSGCVTELKFYRLAIHSYNRCRREQIQFDILPLLSQNALLGHTLWEITMRWALPVELAGLKVITKTGSELWCGHVMN